MKRLKIFLFLPFLSFFLGNQQNAFAQAPNWNDTLKLLMASNLSDSLKVQKLGSTIVVLSNQNNPIVSTLLDSQSKIAYKAKSDQLITAVFYSKASVIYNSASQQELFSQIDSCLYYAKKSNYLIYSIRGNRLKANFFIARHDYKSALEFAENAYSYSKQLNDKREVVKSLAILTQVYESLRYKKELVEFTFESIKIAEENSYHDLLPNLYVKMGTAYLMEGNLKQSFVYYMQAKELAEKKKITAFMPRAYSGLGTYYTNAQKYDSALFYSYAADSVMHLYNNFLTAHTTYLNMAECYVKLNQKDSAKHYFNKCIAIAEKEKMFIVGRIYMNYANFLSDLKEDSLAIKYIDKAIEYIIAKNDRDVMADAFRDKAEIYSSVQNYPKSIDYFKESYKVKDSLSQIKNEENINELLTKFETQKKETEISKLNSDKKIQQLELEKQKATITGNLLEAKHKQTEIDLLNQQQQIQDLKLNQQAEALTLKSLDADTKDKALKIAEQEKQLKETEVEQERTTKNLILAGAIALLAFIVLGFNQYRINLLRKNEKDKYHLQNQLSEMRLEALRSQMNPHFIFNALNSINRYIIRSDKVVASDYLVKFSKLMRLVLENSKSQFVSLQNELDAVQLYTEIEGLRFENKFDFAITVSEDIKKELVKIPPMVLQPFVENAIWHGLMNKSEKGNIQISVSEKETGKLFVVIEDNGVGRQKASELKNNATHTGKSFGMEITKERLKTLNGTDKNFKVIDLFDKDNNPSGTRIEMELNYKAA